MTITPQCFRCARFFADRPGKFQCEPFPEEIPQTILVNNHDHRKHYPGDHGLLFKPIPARRDGEELN